MKKLIIIAVALFFAATGICFSGMKSEKDSMELPSGKWWKLPKIAKDLNITPEEQKKLNSMYAQTRRQMIDMKGELQKELLEIDLLFDEENFDKTACLNRFKKMQKARTDIAIEQFKFITEVRKLFGKERFEQLKVKHRQIRKHRQNWKNFKGNKKGQQQGIKEGSS